MGDGIKMLLSFCIVLCIAFAACCYKNENVVFESESVATENETVESTRIIHDEQWYKDNKDLVYSVLKGLEADKLWVWGCTDIQDCYLEVVDSEGNATFYAYKCDQRDVVIVDNRTDWSAGVSYIALWPTENYNGAMFVGIMHEDGTYHIDYKEYMPKVWIDWIDSNFGVTLEQSDIAFEDALCKDKVEGVI